MKKLSLFLLVAALVATSCKKEDTTTPNDNTDVETTFRNLGRGYDVFDNYADVEQVKGQILDLEKLNTNNCIEIQPVEQGTFHTVEGKTVEQYLNNFTTNTNISGSYSFFSGSLSVNYESSQFSKGTNSFATVQSLIKKNLLQVKKEYSAQNLKNYLTDKFKADINNSSLTSYDIFSMYGTHCMRSIITGGRLDFNVTTDESYVSKSSSIGVQARAAFKSAFASASIENTTVNSNDQSRFEEHMEKKLVIRGGASEFGQYINNDGEYRDWISSIADNQVFCEYGDDPFIPIWELCDNETRSKQLESDFANWANDREYKNNVEKIEITYNFADSTWALTGGGDAHPATETGWVTVESRVTLRPNSTGNVDLVLYFDVFERISNYTRFQGTHIINNIYAGSLYEITGIVGDTTCYCGESINAGCYTWTPFKGTSTFIDNFEYKPDDAYTADVRGRVGIRGTLRFQAYVKKKS